MLHEFHKLLKHIRLQHRPLSRYRWHAPCSPPLEYDHSGHMLLKGNGMSSLTGFRSKFDPMVVCGAILALSALVLTPVSPATAADTENDSGTYTHPEYSMQFTDTPGWRHRPRPGDETTHEIYDPQTGIHVLMWMTSTEQSASRYLSKMSRMMNLTLDSDPLPFRIDEHDSWVLDVPGTIEGESVRTVLAVVPSGYSPANPKEILLYIFQFHCPAEESLELRPVLHGFLHGIRITD
jgi:hypothetical protein